MTTQAQREFDQAYNEFIAAYVESLEQCRASHDEAHDEAQKIVALAKECAKLSRFAGNGDDGRAEDAFEAVYNDGLDVPKYESGQLVRATVTLEMENLK